MGITIEDLDPSAGAARNYFVPAMLSGQTVRLTVGQILDLLIGSAPGTLDTLQELADAINDDASFAATVTAALAQKLALTGGTLTGLLKLAASTTSLSPLNIPSGATPSAPVDGAIWRNDTTGGLMFRKSSVTRQIVDDQNISARLATALLQDQKASGTNGGASVAGWQTRALNTEVYDPDNLVTLSSNQFTPAADCECQWSAPVFNVNQASSRIWNVTDNILVQVGETVWASAGGSTNTPSTRSNGFCRLAAGKTYRLESYAASVQAGNGLGVTANSGSIDIYSWVQLRRL
jgi:hypothetical protein